MSSTSAAISRLALGIANRIPASDFLMLIPKRKIQEAYIAELIAVQGEPESAAQRSYFQFCCQRQIIPLVKYFVLNSVCLISFFPFLFFCWSRGCLSSANRRGKEFQAVFFHSQLANLSDSLKSEFSFTAADSGFVLTLADIRFILKNTLVQHPLSFFFALKTAFRIANYRFNLRHSIRAYIVSCEYSFTSSLGTEWCRANGIEHINIQHGVSLFNFRDSFAQFDRFYVWSEHFRDLYKRLKISSKAFIVEQPSALRAPATIKQSKSEIQTLKYFLQINSEGDLQRISEFLRSLRPRYAIKVRPHPLYTKKSSFDQTFADIPKEGPEISIWESILMGDFLVSRYSAVLYQGALAGQTVVIDDVTAPEYFEHLKELEFVVFKGPYRLLSEFLRKEQKLD